MWTVAGGGEGDCSRKEGKMQRMKKGQENEEGGGWKEKSQIRKVCQDQWGLGPRLRVVRRMVSAKAWFWAQCTIPHYNVLADVKAYLSSEENKQKFYDGLMELDFA